MSMLSYETDGPSRDEPAPTPFMIAAVVGSDRPLGRSSLTGATPAASS